MRLLRPRTAVIALALGLPLTGALACTGDSAPAAQRLSHSHSHSLTQGLPSDPAVDPTAAPGTDRATSNDLERQAKAASRAPVGPVPVEIDRAEARAYRRVDALVLPQAARAKLARISLPTLLPSDPTLLASTQLTRGELWYAAALRSADGLNVHVHGTRGAFEVPGASYPAAAVEAADDYTLTRTHGIVTIRFNAFGAAYNVDVECAEPLADPRCTDDAFALDLAESLGVADPDGGPL